MKQEDFECLSNDEVQSTLLRNALLAYQGAEEEMRKMSETMQSASAQLFVTVRQSTVSCPCGHRVTLGVQVEAIHEFFNGRRPAGEDNYEYQDQYFFVCRACAELVSLPAKIGKYPIELLVKSCSQYYRHSNSGKPSQEYARMLLKPHHDKQSRERESREKERKLEEARRLLRENGELP